MDFRDHESCALLALMLTPGLGQTLIGRCVEAFGSAEAVLGVSGQQLGGVKGISPKRSGELKRKLDEVLQSGAVERELEAVRAAGVSLVHRESEAYPRLLKLIPDPPLLLWVRGELREDDALALGIVGSRRCSHYGREQADRFAAQCASAGLCIVSGGAYGIDIAAHRAAMRVKGRTIAVIGSGLGVPYPKDHVPVFDEIVDEGLGAVVSEFPMGVGPKPENFPRRNRIISGMAMGVLVVEAAKRSGALITARLCVEDHCRECMALPGRVDAPGSAGCHKIIREGWATLVTSAADVLDQLGDAGQLLKAGLDKREQKAKPQAASEDQPGSLFDVTLTEPQKKLVEALSEGRSLDELVAWMGGEVGPVQADLTMLEIRGVIQRRGGLFVRRR
ncbi:DNA-processing protein DprA [Algisphaera agarilytica]|uniref:DNA processing protein n=1 Tax=Algisphaera agarilytica TaxID=1385975 RepID=A0A7X0LL03_9BACT|nr:DNA-processing protein DprA [Algisphaera agarilytica]MBB6430487.1 DNA processing protein [Algisphaera agarilytica]